MARASHAAARTSADEPTFSQLKELFAQLEAQKVSRKQLQDFLRRRPPADVETVAPVGVLPQTESAEDKLLVKLTAQVEMYYPHCVSEMMDFLKPIYFPGSLEVGSLKRAPHPDGSLIGVEGSELVMPENIGKFTNSLNEAPALRIADQLYAEEFRTFRHLDPEFGDAAYHLVCDYANLQSRLWMCLKDTYAYKYGLYNGEAISRITGSVEKLARIGICLVSRDDRSRLAPVIRLIKRQLSGNPIITIRGKVAYILSVPEVK